MSLTVSGLAIAPVKALALVPRTELWVGPDGVAEDRRLFMVTSTGRVVTLRDFPALASVRPELDLPRGRIGLAFPDGTTAAGPLSPVGPEISASFLGKPRTGRVVSGAPARALSAFLGRPVRLVLAERAGIGWDEGPVTVLGSGSVAAVAPPADRNSAPARAVGSGPVPSTGPGQRRFRMLINVAGTAPFEEDGWVGHRVVLGGLTIEVTEPLGRCVVITRSPDTGRPDWDGLRAVARRRDGVTLGVVAAVVEPGTVRLGDRVSVRRRSR